MCEIYTDINPCNGTQRLWDFNSKQHYIFENNWFSFSSQLTVVWCGNDICWWYCTVGILAIIMFMMFICILCKCSGFPSTLIWDGFLTTIFYDTMNFIFMICHVVNKNIVLYWHCSVFFEGRWCVIGWLRPILMGRVALVVRIAVLSVSTCIDMSPTYFTVNCI